MAEVIDIRPQRVRIGDGTNTVFDTNNGYLVKEENLILPSNTDKIFTRTLNLNGKQIIPEVNTLENLQRPFRSDDWGDYQIYGRDTVAPGTAVSRPFLEFYTYNGSPETRFYCFLLLVDISPLRQGFYEFYVNDTKFYGFVRKLEKYDHYNWQVVSGVANTIYAKYSWVKQSQPLGYGIEIAPMDLFYNYDEDLGDGGAIKRVAEKPLLQTLRNLRGGEEIISSVSPVNPALFDTRVFALPLGFFQVGEDGNQDVFSYSEGYDLLKLSPTDALCYVASHKDLIELYGTGTTAKIIQNGQNHWIRRAEREGRTITFNPIAYINKYSDMKQQYTTASSINAAGAAEHFIRSGFAGGRNLDGASTFYPNSRGALYDERFGSVNISDEFLVYPNGQTIAGKGNSLTYRFNNTIYYLNGNLPTNEKTIFLKKQ
jgi:hypothetical protein